MQKGCFYLLLCLLISCGSVQQKTATYKVIKIKTSYGDMLCWLYDETPNHKKSFIKLATEHYFNDFTFDRVIENFVIQGGCPDTPEGFSEEHYLLESEFKQNLKHVYGALGAGRDNNPDKISACCQFYIVHRKEGLPRLDGNYVIFGQVFKGLDVLEKIATVKTNSLDVPLEAIQLDVQIVELSEKRLLEMGCTFIKK